MDFTIEFTSGGNHGHQLKDALGGLTIGRLFNLNYVHTPYEYLDYFGFGFKYPVVNKADRKLKYKNIIRVEGPLWCGIDDYEELLQYFEKALPQTNNDTLVILENALRIHPFQTIPWYLEGKTKKNIFTEIQQEMSGNFNELHSLQINKFKSPVEVAVHINRGTDYDREKFPQHFTSPFAVRYMFDMDYYENIILHIEEAYGVGNVCFNIYTEKQNAEDILLRFDKREHTRVIIGSDREEKNYDQIHSIFKSFVEADILVCSNSSFSVMCAYFRKGRKTVYHPHLQLRYLPEPNYIKTEDDGSLDIALLQQEITADTFTFHSQGSIV
ncbi:hypothetical protein [Flavobacterium flavigenum]|uniref:hypothetical protein n=1 Tax=Flavobacterium flavigenum TaxID=3003258 RepID=UPI002482284A|nr:hypothetical protein [Flavobacterium flavigenum]